MTLTTRTPMRRCGTRWATEYEALHSKLYLSGGQEVIPCVYGCGGYHLSEIKSAATARAATPKDTGPDHKTRAVVLQRDGYQCARCGRPCGPGIGPYSLQHRKARGVGGDSSAPNLVLLCGTATTQCHGEVETRHDPHDLEAGYRLESWQDPLAEGVMYFERDAAGLTAWLLPDGGLNFEGPGVAA